MCVQRDKRDKVQLEAAEQLSYFFQEAGTKARNNREQNFSFRKLIVFFIAYIFTA